MSTPRNVAPPTLGDHVTLARRPGPLLAGWRPCYAAGGVSATMRSVELVERRPSVEEYARLIAAVQWKPRDPEAIALALAGSIFACYLTDIVVDPAYQRRGVGARIVRALTERMEGV